MQQYVYDRAVCTGLGDRVGAMMTLATLARLNYVSVVFRWCGDPSEIFPSQHRYMPKWHGFDYNLTDFRARFLPPEFPLDIVTPDLSPLHKSSERKVVWQGLAVPAEAGLDQAYTTAWRAVQLPGRPVLDAELYKQSYRWVARAVVLQAVKAHPHVIDANAPYVVLHLRGPDDNTYDSFLGCHDAPSAYCTGSVVKKALRRVPGLKIFAVTNNASWARDLVRSRRVTILDNTHAYDDFALLLGASAIVQHANYGWSSFSSNPGMMAGVPTMVTFRRHLQHNRLGFFDNYGGIPDEFYDCERQREFVEAMALSVLRSPQTSPPPACPAAGPRACTAPA